MEYSGQFFRASYGNLWQPFNTADVQSADLQMLLSLGVQQIRIDASFDPWLQNNSQYIAQQTTNVNAIRTAGKKLVIADAGAQSYFNQPLTWAQFKAAWTTRVQTLAQLYQPDYYIVIKEPGWYVPMISDAKTNPLVQSISEWTTLLDTLDNAVKAISPSTQTGISGSWGDQDKTILAAVPPVASCDFIGIDTYNPANNSSISSWITKLGTIPQKIWIAECWSSTDPLHASKAQSDATWMLSEGAFATSINASAMNPFYSEPFAMYSEPTDTATILRNYQNREPVYYAYQNVIFSGLIPVKISL